MSLATHSGWRVPHRVPGLVAVARFLLPGGEYTFTGGGPGESGGWRIAGAGDWGMYRWSNPGEVETLASLWLDQEVIPANHVLPEDILYTDALSKPYATRCTLLSGTSPAGGGVGPWIPLPNAAEQTWYLNTGGSPGESASFSILVELSEMLQPTGQGPILASGTYDLTVTRT